MPSIQNRNHDDQPTLQTTLRLYRLVWGCFFLLFTGCAVPNGIATPPLTDEMPTSVSTAWLNATVTPSPTATPTVTLAVTPDTTTDTIPTVTPAITPVTTDSPCKYAGIVLDAKTNAPIVNAKVTLHYQEDIYTQYTDSVGVYRGEILCTQETPRYQIQIDAPDYQPYQADLRLADQLEDIYLFSNAIDLCRYVIAVMDATTQDRIADAKVRLEQGLYYTIVYTDSEGDAHAMLPCINQSPQIAIWVHADDYEVYRGEYVLQNEIIEIHLTRSKMPTPTPTPTRFPRRAEGETLVLIVDFWVSLDADDDQRIAC
ncbi:MAG: carboxypeptidase-like regulatory domain-containing protein [Chloroflexota bacterium]